jgi:transposase
MCGIDDSTDALYWRIHDGPNDSNEFSYDVEQACIKQGYLRADDVLVLDNATIHNGKDNKYLEDFVWNTFCVFILFLPTRSPEWNPQELVWQVMMRKMQFIPLHVLRQHKRNSSAIAAHTALSE